MKLRNKKTGQLGNFIINKDHFECVDLDYVPEYRNLAELNEEWEDVQEVKDNDYWYLDDFGKINFSSEILDEIKGEPNNWISRKLIGNYFETKEEAEKAVEKLMAWKRLKDKGIRFSGFAYTELSDCARINIQATIINDSVNSDLDLLFGGEE